jgi:hypothetical protein
MKQKSLFLYNPWTGVAHGHARNELNIAKDFLRKSGQSAEIISSDVNYGDVSFEAQMSAMTRLPDLLQRGQIFRFSKYQEQKIQANSLAKLISRLASDNPSRLVVTSSKPIDLILFQNMQFRNLSMSIRVISPPENEREINAFLEMSKNDKISIAFETNDGTAKAENLSGKKLLTVPPIQGISNLPDAINRKSIGIFWPVSYFESEGSVRALLKQVSRETCIVRLPGNVDKEKFIKDFPGNEYINRGISDADFNHYVNQVNIAILPHKGYKLRGSGLAAIFAGKGIPILTDSSNSFFADVNGKSDIMQISSDVLSDINMLKLSAKKNRTSKNLYHNWTRLQWTKFFEDTRGQ